jgi:plasmid stability protein
MRALADGGLRFERVGEPAGARLRIRFAESGNGVYGEARRIQVKGLRGAEISPPVVA